MKDQEKENNTKCLNTQRWNPYICTTHQTFILQMFGFVSHFQIGKLLLKWSNLNSYEKSLLATNAMQLTLCLVVPLYMFAKNKSIFQHLIHEILGDFIVLENMPTNSHKLPSLYSSVQKMKRLSQKLQSNSDPTDTGTTIKIMNEKILNQGQEGTFDKVKDKPNHDYPNCLPYRDQKALLSAARLKNAGFQLSNNTPEDGNCLIHALKDQMR